MEGKEFLQRVLSPLVIVASSQTATEIAEKNEIENFAEFLAPFGTRLTAQKSIDAVGNKISVDPAYLRFQDLNSFKMVEIDEIHKKFLKIMPTYNGQQFEIPVIKSKAEAEKYRVEGNLESLSPWFHQYKSVIAKQMGPSEHETINHPVALLIVLTTADPDPISLLNNLGSEQNLPEIFKSHFIDPNMLKYCLLLHEPSNGTLNSTLENSLKNVMPTHTLIINSRDGQEISTPVVPDIWAPTLAERSVFSTKADSMEQIPQQIFHHRASVGSISEQKRGLRLSLDDFAAISKFLDEFFAPAIFNELGKNVQKGEKEIVSARRGISNRLFKVGLKYFGSSKSAQQLPDAPQLDQYTNRLIFPYSSPEMTLRRLADTSFMLRDYKYAQSIYQFLKKDFESNEKYRKFLGGVQEMLTLINLLLSFGPSYEPIHLACIQAYSESKSVLYSTRSTILVVEIMKEAQAFREGAFILIRMAKDDDDLKCALFLEQAAICFLRSYPPLPRRYSFHLFLAAHRYSKCGLRNHSDRNYIASISIYEERKWSLINDHINYSLGKQNVARNNLVDGIKYYMKLLYDSRSSSSNQRIYLSEFLQVYQELSTLNLIDPELNRISIPIFSKSETKVMHRGKLSGNVSASKDVEFWDSLETCLQQEASKIVAPRRFKNSSNSSNDIIECAIGETVTLSFKWKNAIKVPLPINNVHLHCTFNGQDIMPANLTEDRNLSSCIETEYFKVEVVSDCALDSKEKRQVELKIHPLREGEIQIEGIRYLLCGIMPCFRNMEDLHSSQKSIVIRVLPPMPIIDLSFHNLNTNIYSGQVSKVTLEINNKGTKGMMNLFVQVSNPSVCWFNDSSCLESSFYTSINELNCSEIRHNNVSNRIIDKSTFKLHLPASEGSESINCLGAGETTLVSMWVHGAELQNTSLNLLFAYQSTDPNDDSYHTFQFSHKFQVIPIISVGEKSWKSEKYESKQNFTLKVSNLHSSGIRIKQITSLSPNWILGAQEDRKQINDSFNLNPGDKKNILLDVERYRSPDIGKSQELITANAIKKFILTGQENVSDYGELSLLSRSKGSSTTIDIFSPLFLKNFVFCKANSRTRSLKLQYPHFSTSHLKIMFPLYWNDDIDLIIFYETLDSSVEGHILMSLPNAVAENPLPLSIWLSEMETKVLTGRSLFENTHRERMALISNLLKSRVSDRFPVYVSINAPSKVDLVEDEVIVEIKYNLKNESWIHEIEYEFMVEESLINGMEIPNFHLAGHSNVYGRLLPLGSSEISVTAIFSFRGIYNISNWKLNLKTHLTQDAINVIGNSGVGSGKLTNMQGVQFQKHICVL